MTGASDDELAALRGLYLREAAPRLEALERALDALARRPSDRGALALLGRGFHSFGGSGATYGLPPVSALGVEGERRVNDVGAAEPVPSDLAFWRKVVAALRAEIEKAGS
jgi:chemotaxis protein histidine kinase CheA